MTPAPGAIVLLNGAPRSGKSSIARAMQEKAPGLWINLGVDLMMQATPAKLRPGIGLRPGSERPDLEPAVQQLYRTLFAAIAAAARSGVNVVADLGMHDEHSRPLGILADAVAQLRGLPVLFVAVTAPLKAIMARRNADPQGGYYAAGDAVPAPVLRWQAAPHAHGVYDLELDTALLTPAAAAVEIMKALATPPAPSAFERLSRRPSGRRSSRLPAPAAGARRRTRSAPARRSTRRP